MTTPCELVQIEYQGNGSLSVFAFPFPYDFKTEVRVALWNNTTKKHEEILTTDATYPWEVNDANPTAVTFTGTAPPAPPTPDVNEDPIFNVRVFRITDLTDIRSVFNQGSAIRATDLNKNFEQLRYSIQEGKCQIPDKLLEYLDEYYWNNYSDVIYSNEPWVSNDQTIATTASLDQRFQDEADETLISSETWVANDDLIPTTQSLENRFDTLIETDILIDNTGLTKNASGGQTTLGIGASSVDLDRIKNEDIIVSGEANPNNDTTIATTAKIDDMIDEAITGDIAVDSTGLTFTDDGDGTITLGIGQNSVDLDRIKTADIVQTADYATTWTGDDDKVATVGALEARHDVIVNSDINAPVTDQPGKQWLNLIPGNQVYRIYDGSNWRAVSVGTPYTPVTSTIVRYVDVTNGSDQVDVTGFLPQAPLRSIKRALTLVNASSTGDGTLIIVAPGTYQEELPLRIEKNNVSIVGTSMRSCFVHPTVATENNDMFEVTSGTYISNLTLLGLKVPTSDQGVRNNSLDNDATYGLPSNQPFAVRFRTDIQPIILKSPYIQNCTHFSDAQFDNANFDPNTFQSTDAETYSSVAGDGSSAPCGGGLLVDGAAVSSSSPIRSMVVDAFTQICLDGPGILVTNNGYAQLVSFFGTFTHYHAKAKNGGQLNLSNCVSDFGRYGLIADGKSPNAIATASISSPSVGAGLGNTTVTIGALTQGTFHGTVSQPLNTMMITIDGVDYGVVNSVANGAGWDVTLTSGLTSNITSTNANFALRSYISTGGHTFEFVGVGTNYSDHPDEGGIPIEANQVIELNSGKVWQSSTDQIGKFKAGSTLVVDQVSETVALKDTNVTGTLAVSEAASANSLNVTTNTTTDSLTVTNAASANELTVGNNATITNNLTVSNDATVSNDLTVSNDATVSNDLTVSNNFNISSLQNVIVGSKNLEELIAERARDSRRIYISKDVKASDSNNGTSPEEPFATFAAAIAAAQPGDLIEVAPGIYTESSLPLRIPRNVGIFASSLRQVQIRPAAGQEMNGFFKVDSGFWCWGLEFAGHQADLANNQQSWAISFDDQADNTGIGASTVGAYIFKSPYVQNCSSVTAEDDAGNAGSVSTGDTGGGMEVDGDKCALNSPIRSMVVDSYTQVNLGGPGCLVKNDGYAQLVSFFGTFCTFHVKTETGGQANLSGGGTSDFGDQGLVADGYSRLPNFTGDSRVAVYGADRIEAAVTINTTSDTFTTATNHGLSVNDQVTFKATDGNLPTEIVTGTTYYIINANFTSTVFSVSATEGGAAVNMTGSATGTYQVTRQGQLTADVVSFTSNRIGSLSRPNPGQLMFPRQTFPSAGEPGSTGNAVTVTVTSGSEFTLPLNTFSYAHEYVTGGTVTVGGTPYNVTSAVYDNTTGVITLTASGYTPSNGDSAVLSGLEFICPNQGAYVVTSSVPIDANGNNVAVDSPSLAGYRLNFYNSVNGGLRSPLSAGQTIDFRLRSQVSCSLHTMEYVGSGTNYNALPWNGGVPIAANQRVELNNGRVFGATINEKGDFEIGDNTFSIDGTTGSATINTSEFNISGLNFVGPFSRNGGFSTVGVQLREVSDNTSLIASTGAPDGNTVPTQNAVKDYVDTNLATKANLVGGKLAASEVPDLAITEFKGAVANQAAMLAITGEKGDWVTRNDDGKVYIITGTDPTQIGSWTALSYPASPVLSVNTETGAVVLDADDISDATTTNKFTTAAEATKLSGIAAGAEVNVQADWNESDSGSDAFIQNKPTIPAAYTNANVDAHLNTSTAANGEVLSWTGTDYDWVVQSGGGGGGNTDLSYTDSTRVIASSTGTDATLPLMSSANAGLVPASGGGTTNFLRADGTFTAFAASNPVALKLPIATSVTLPTTQTEQAVNNLFGGTAVFNSSNGAAWSFNASSITIPEDGVYCVSIDVTVQSTSQRAQNLFLLAIGGTPQEGRSSHAYVRNSSTINEAGCTLTELLDLTAGDVLTVRGRAEGTVSGARSTSSATPGSISIHKVSNPQGPTGPTGPQGPSDIPQNSQTSAYTLVAGDNGKHINTTTGGVTIPSGVFSAGNVVTIYNDSSSNQVITQGSGVTLRLAGTTSTSNRNLASYGICTLLCVASNEFVISGAGLT